MLRFNDKMIHKSIKFIMSLIWLWSGLFWSGITAIYFLTGRTEAEDSAPIAVKMLLGSGILLAGLILCWLRLDILQFVPTAAGLIVFLIPVREMMNHVSSSAVFKPSFEARYLPTVAMAILSLCLLLMRLWELHMKKAERIERFNNSPSESILDKHRED